MVFVSVNGLGGRESDIPYYYTKMGFLGNSYNDKFFIQSYQDSIARNRRLYFQPYSNGFDVGGGVIIGSTA